ncbi:MAG: hypothetical protein WCB67_18600 [Solirubrobacteraceae bacterium]
MPFVIHPRIRKGLGRLAAMTATGVLASTGVAAAASCPTLATTTPLSQFGDTNNYFVVPGGTFEGSSLPAGWTASGASLTAGSEPFHVLNASDNQSLTIQAGGSVTTPYACIDATMPEMRFFAHQIGSGSDLKVDVLVKLGGWTMSVPLADLADGSMPAWALTDPILAPPGQSLAPGVIVQGALRFSVTGSGNQGWQIDDILVDPYRSA